MPPGYPRPRLRRVSSGRAPGRSPHPVDLHVGARVRMRRILLGLTQGKLATAIGMTFQQIQKYERGANRISASRLFELARVLDVPVAFFFDAMDDNPAANHPATTPPAVELDHLARPETLELIRAYYRVFNPTQRKLMFELLKTMAAENKAPPE